LLQVDNCDSIVVKGDCNTVQTTNGNIVCGNVTGDVTTKNGNATCENVNGSVTTKNGNITHR